MAEEREQQQPIGAGHLKAMLRAGAKELAQILPAFPDSVRPVEEPGLVGNLTPQEIVHDKQKLDNLLDGYAGRVQQGREQDQGMER
jgi:hypothetical protein